MNEPGGREVLLKTAIVPARSVGVSVIIPSHNTRPFVVGAIRSALQQTYSALEVIVVDDGSTDDSVDDVLAIADDRLTCVVQPNRGLSAARNTGIRLARGAYLAFLDSDDLWSPLKIAHHLALMERKPTIGVSFSYSAYLHQNGQPTGEYLITRCARPTVWQLMLRNHLGNGSTPVVRRECFDTAGHFDESLSGCADWEFWVRVAARGWSFQLIPKVLTGYRIRNGSLSVAQDRYESFLADGLEAIDRFRTTVPDCPAATTNGARAQLFRVASRKALHTGEVALSRRLLREAVRHSPSTVLTDARAMALIAFHVLTGIMPRSLQLSFLHLGSILLRRGLWKHLVDTPDRHGFGASA